MEITFYVLKCGEQYVRTNAIRSGSVHLTNRLADADRFGSEEFAKNFFQSLMINSKDYMIDSSIKMDTVKIVSEILKIEDNFKNL
ncbi:hypothetical protein [Domibacillus epiphyticus]|uniref:Uncharacterized protein n=1 Tax=Domibacillus epiphyticus TaxID=1714355 RepID=A0A1V2A3R9_9BACI|nr:hypothetical protein [Domibacillus epiphyticus]OMP65655.1 hypothetical protein BTO28_16380 [Domibacillus epiphyticus]